MLYSRCNYSDQSQPVFCRNQQGAELLVHFGLWLRINPNPPLPPLQVLVVLFIRYVEIGCETFTIWDHLGKIVQIDYSIRNTETRILYSIPVFRTISLQGVHANSLPSMLKGKAMIYASTYLPSTRECRKISNEIWRSAYRIRL